MIFETLLFILLSPGLLLTLPAVSKRGYMSFKTSCMAIFIHAAVFAVLLYFKSYIPILGSLEGFQNTPPAPMIPPASMNPSASPPMATSSGGSTMANSSGGSPMANSSGGSAMGRIPMANSNSTANPLTKKIADSTATAAAQAYEMALQAQGGKYDEATLGNAKKVMEAAINAAK